MAGRARVMGARLRAAVPLACAGATPCTTAESRRRTAPTGIHSRRVSPPQDVTSAVVYGEGKQMGKQRGWRRDGWPARRRASNVDGEETNGHQAGGPQPGPAQPGEASSVEPVSPPESRGGREVGGVFGQPGRAAREV